MSTPWAALQGNLQARATSGPLQRTEAQMPKGGALIIGEASQEINGAETPDFRARNILISKSAPSLPGFSSISAVPAETRKTCWCPRI